MTRAEVLETATQCVCQDRNQQYGEPEDNFSVIADLWSTFLSIDVSAEDVALMMILLKVAREKTGGSVDNLVDVAGYAACAGELVSDDRSSAQQRPGVRYF